MTPALSVLLCLGLCLDQRMRTQVAADRLPKPSLWLENDSALVTAGRNVTLSCRGSQLAQLYHLEKRQYAKWSVFMDVRATGGKAKFSIPSVTASHAGTYNCFYRHSSHWSEYSDPMELVVTDLYDQPSLSALPSPEVASGQNVTLQCSSEQSYDWCALFKDGEWITYSRTRHQERGHQADFPIPAVNSNHNGTYRCYSILSDAPSVWSSPSIPLVLRVTDAAAQDYTVGNLVRLILAGLVLVLLGVLLAEHWKSSRGHKQQLREPALGTTMAPTLSALLCSIDALPRPSLTVEPGLVNPEGQTVSFRCQGPPEAELYRLKKEGTGQFMDRSAAEEGGLFVLETTSNHAGNYSCLYKSQTAWSEASHALQLVVTGLYDPPSLTALPGPSVTAGQSVTLRCRAESWYSSAALAKDGESVGSGSARPSGPGSQTDFLLPAVTAAQGGTYRCYSFHSTGRAEWSSPSNPLVLRVTASPGFSSLQIGILVGISAFLVLTFLSLSLLCLGWCRSRLGKGGRETEVKTTRRS
ncbi:leukocyte immunoglobulin-like receptor subfamily B member 3, partial [Gracilinanus agilis]|uniref:leukocyte immunoglobulin-like receptor subfamily B member 3 n=1 Tax=Gracilinanus agilis TaxID=191870 RepID=UPI001CFCFBD8